MTAEELRTRLRATLDLPFGPARTAAVEEVIRQADALGLTELQYAGRVLSLNAYRYGGEPARTFVPFAWCLAAHDRGEGDPGLDHTLFWNFKGIISSLADFPEVPLEQTQAVLAEMERRYRQAGHVLNPVHQYRELLARHVGDRETAAEQFRLWQASPRGEMSDCVGCEPNGKINHLVWLGRDEEAVAAAQPVLSGRLNCTEQPHTIRTDLLLPYLRTGRFAEAAEAHRAAYRAIRHNRAELGLLAGHLRFCAVTGNHARGLELLERHLGWLDEPSSPAAAMRFAAAAALVLTRVVEAGHPETRLRRPAHRDRAAAEPSAAALRAELTELALDLAARFDHRNGSTEQGDQVRATLAAQPLAEHLPLSGPARAAAQPAVAEPVPVAVPQTPEELAEAAEDAYNLREDERGDALWARFDELCPDPPPVLRARRQIATAIELVESDPAAAEAALRGAAALFAEHGEPVLAAIARSRAALACCHDDRAEQGLAELHAVAAELAEAGAEVPLLRVRSRIVTALLRAGEQEAARRLARELAEAADAHPDRLLAADLWIAVVHTWRSEEQPHPPEALAPSLRAAEILAELPECPLLHHIRLATGNMFWANEDPETAYRLFVAVTRAADPEPRALAQHMAGALLSNHERHEEAYGHFSAGLTEVLRHELDHDVPELSLEVATAALKAGRPEQAADLAEEVLGAEAEPHQHARARLFLAHAHRALGQPEAALTVLAELAEQCAAEDNQLGLARAQVTAAEILDGLDRDAEAAQRYQAAAEVLSRAEEPLAALEHFGRAAVSWHWAGEPGQAAAALAAADALAATLGEEPEVRFRRAALDYDAARVLSAAQDRNPALARATAAVRVFHELEAAEAAVAAEVLRGRLLVDLGRGGEAEPVLRAALDRLEQDSPQREQVAALLAGLTR